MASISGRILSVIISCLMMNQVCGGIEAPKVKLDLYYESLCPFCANFIINPNGGLPVLFQTALIHIVDLRLFPWGNAWFTSNNSFVCQVFLISVTSRDVQWAGSTQRIMG